METACTPCSWFYFCFTLEIIEVAIRPRPNPARIDPTNARADAFRKKNPIPMPISNPPPMAHVLLSPFSFVLSILEASRPMCSLVVQACLSEHPTGLRISSKTGGKLTCRRACLLQPLGFAGADDFAQIPHRPVDDVAIDKKKCTQGLVLSRSADLLLDRQVS